MFRWITKSRLRTALAILFFGVVFVVSVPLMFLARAGAPEAALPPDSHSAGSGSGSGHAYGSPDILPIASMVTAAGSVLGTISTVILAWRADRRTAKESTLKMLQLQQQITELELKLKAPATEKTPSRIVLE